MDAQVGDQFVVNSRIAGKPPRVGEIIECIDQGGLTPHFRVRWADGHESVVYPGSDAKVAPAAAAPGGPERRSVTISVKLLEDRDHCEATATFATSMGEFTATGEAKRNPTDPVNPLIGEELAIARALGQLAARLEAEARQAIDAHEEQDRHLVP